MLGALRELVLSAFDRYPVPAALGADAWSAARDDLANRLAQIGLHPPKRVIDIPVPHAERYFACMPIHEKLRGQRLSDHPQLPDGHALQHPRRIDQAHGRPNAAGGTDRDSPVARRSQVEPLSSLPDSATHRRRSVDHGRCDCLGRSMIGTSSATPLIALDAVVIDTETTGLDPRKAWIVEIAAVRIAGGRLQTGERVPAAGPSGRADSRRCPPRFTASTRRRSPMRPSFAEVWPELSRLSRRRGGDRPRARLRPRRAQARMRARRPGLDAVRARSTRGCSPRSPSPISPASRSTVSPPGSASRSPTAIPRAATRIACARIFLALRAEAARGRHPHAGGGRARLPRADRRAGRAAPRRLGRAGRGAEPGRRRADAAAHRQLCLSPPRRRHHARAAALRRRGQRRSATRSDA